MYKKVLMSFLQSHVCIYIENILEAHTSNSSLLLSFMGPGGKKEGKWGWEKTFILKMLI